jgi:hypothetical protein
VRWVAGTNVAFFAWVLWGGQLMVHIPSAEIYQEILNVPHLIRLTEAYGDAGSELTLIVRCSSIGLKFLVQQTHFYLVLMRLKNGVLVYAIKVEDSVDAPMSFWSAVKNSNELSLFHRLLTDRRVVVHLSNEACVNSAWTESVVELGADVLNLIGSGIASKPGVDATAMEVSDLLNTSSGNSNVIARFHVSQPWKPISATLITNGPHPWTIDILNDEEGSHQEKLAAWMIDGLSPDGGYLNPQFSEPSGPKEFTDLLLSCSIGSVVIESKTLAILARKKLPTRDKLARDTVAGVRRAAQQLRNVCRKIHSGQRIFDKQTKNEVSIDRDHPIQALCLVPDLSLLIDCTEFGADFVKQFKKLHGDEFQIIDTTQLFRIVQAAHMLSVNSTESRMAAFDAYLSLRSEFARQNNTFSFDMILDLNSVPPRVRFSVDQRS